MLTNLLTLPAPLDFQPMVSWNDSLERLEALAGVSFQNGDDELGDYRMWLFQHDEMSFIVSVRTNPATPSGFFLDMDPTSTCDIAGAVDDVLEVLLVPPSSVVWRNGTWLHPAPAVSEAV